MSSKRWFMVGDATVIAGGSYTAVAVEPHTRQDGTPTQVVTWNGFCANCGSEYQCKTGINPERQLRLNCTVCCDRFSPIRLRKACKRRRREFASNDNAK